MSDSFLSRWSRRKQAAAAQPETVRETAPDLAPPGIEPALAARVEPAQEPTLSPEDLAALPAIDTLEAETDITGFLRQGVPHVLRNAALRRAWALDPKVRDFVCEAREYAYDWNVPGGVPGAGPLLPTDDPQAMVEKMFSRFGQAEPEDEPAETAALTAGETADESAGEGGADVPLPEAQEASALESPPDEPRPIEASLPAPTVPFVTEEPGKVPVRRHGGAVPD